MLDLSNHGGIARKKISPVVATELKSKNYIIKFTYCLKKSILKLKKKTYVQVLLKS